MTAKLVELQPLPEALLIAGDLRRKAKEMILLAQRLEATCRLPDTGPVEFIWAKKRKPPKEQAK